MSKEFIVGWQLDQLFMLTVLFVVINNIGTVVNYVQSSLALSLASASFV